MFTIEGVNDHRGRPVEFDVVVTDPMWVERLKVATGIDARKVTPEALGIDKTNQAYFTVSLGEAFHGDHYKLVAAVII